MRLRLAGVTLALFVTVGSPALAQTWPARLAAATVEGGRVGTTAYPSSSRLSVTWTAPAEPVHHYVLRLTDGVTGAAVALDVTGTRTTVTGLKSATPHTASVKACLDEACATVLDGDAGASAETAPEYWQVQGSGGSYSGATKIISDGNTYPFALPYGPWAGALNGKVQLYYNPFGASEKGIKIAELTAATGNSVASLSSYRPISGFGMKQLCAVGGPDMSTPCTADTVAASITTTQPVALDASMGGGVRLFFEAMGPDRRTRVMYVDSRDGYVGRDFNAGPKTICDTAADFAAGGGCAPTVVIGVGSDAIAGNPGLSNARQFKIGYPTRADWRWNGQPGAFMVITAEFEGPCSSESFFNASVAIWDGASWVMQKDAAGCPRYMQGVQAPMPVHVGGTRYKMYFSNNTIPRMGMANPLTDIKPMKLVYADGGVSGDPGVVEFDDWEQIAQAREVHFLWPNGGLLDVTNESTLDDYIMFMPTGDPSLQIMYGNMSIPGSGLAPFIGMAALVNP